MRCVNIPGWRNNRFGRSTGLGNMTESVMSQISVTIKYVAYTMTRPQGYKTFMLSSAETKIYPAHKF